MLFSESRLATCGVSITLLRQTNGLFSLLTNILAFHLQKLQQVNFPDVNGR